MTLTKLSKALNLWDYCHIQNVTLNSQASIIKTFPHNFDGHIDKKKSSLYNIIFNS